MKYQIKYNPLAFSLTLLSMATCAFAATPPAKEVPIETFLAPSYGFEEKNDIQAVLYGVLPNSCYSLSEYRVETNLEKNEITIYQYANKVENGICANEATLPPHMSMAIPFTKEVSFGRLAKGDYTFLYRKAAGDFGSRIISVASNVTPSPDTLPYAAVLNTMVSSVQTASADVEATITGVLNSSCTELDDEVQILKEGDVFVLLPTVKLKPNVICSQVLTPFEKKVNLGKVKAGRYLLHTRSMNGQAVNRIFEINS